MVKRLPILVTGASGLVGSRFVELFPQKDQLATPDLPDFDLTNRANCLSTVSRINPGVIIHFAAFTDVCQAQIQRGDKTGSCWQVNVTGTSNLTEAARICSARLIYISTDMVFPGSKEDPGPYSESHPLPADPQSVTWYGASKGEGERIVSGFGTIVRIIYPARAVYPLKLDYLRKPLKLFDAGQLYPLFTDQQISLTFIDELCLALERIITADLTGTFHVSSPDTATPYELISYLIDQTRGQTHAVKPASLRQFLATANNPVRYPMFGGLKVRETEKKLGLKFSSWKKIIDQLVEQGISV